MSAKTVEALKAERDEWKAETALAREEINRLKRGLFGRLPVKPWRMSPRQVDAVIADEHPGQCVEDDYYGGHFVCESVRPQCRALITSAPVLRAALEPLAEVGTDLTNAACHVGLCSAEECVRCSKVLAARAALALAEGTIR